LTTTSFTTYVFPEFFPYISIIDDDVESYSGSSREFLGIIPGSLEEVINRKTRSVNVMMEPTMSTENSKI